MQERSGGVTFQGNPLTLVGTEVKVGDSAPDVEVLGNDLGPVKLSSYQGKVCVISVGWAGSSSSPSPSSRFGSSGVPTP